MCRSGYRHSSHGVVHLLDQTMQHRQELLVGEISKVETERYTAINPGSCSENFSAAYAGQNENNLPNSVFDLRQQEIEG
jgi:hypothetical protein